MKERPKVLLFEPMHEKGMGLLVERCELLYLNSFDEEEIVRKIRDVDGVIIRANGAVTRRAIEAASRLKVIGRHGVGLDNVDLQAARERGIQVVYTPYANTESVAEHFVALALMLAKRMRLADRALREGNWKARYELIGVELQGKTLGVVGFGRIGRRTAEICHFGFQMDIVYHDVARFKDMEKRLNAKWLSLQELFRVSDFISINLPLSPATRGIINADLLRLMKPTAFLINLARGPVWNERDVLKALQEGWIAGVGSDVYEEEPASPENPLFQMDNFVGTPHMAAHTEESMVRMSMVAQDVISVLEGREPRHPVPDELYGASR
jgi:D-3-phosphoglycerate dehydrogenase